MSTEPRQITKINSPIVNFTDIYPREWVSFISKYSTKELSLNGHNMSIDILLSIFEIYLPFLEKGNYLELGCGSGILSRFLYLFSPKKIVLYGIDSNPIALKLAKKNNSKFADNYINEDYFDTLKSNKINFNKFATIHIFAFLNTNKAKELLAILLPVIIKCNNTNFIITDFDYDFLDIKDKLITEFINTINKISHISIASHSVLIISNNKKMHAIAKKRNEAQLKMTKESEILMKKLAEKPAKVLVVPMEVDMPFALEVAGKLRELGVPTELYTEDDKFKKKLMYANKIGVPFVAIIGEDEVNKKKVALKNMKTGKQELVSIGENQTIRNLRKLVL